MNLLNLIYLHTDIINRFQFVWFLQNKFKNLLILKILLNAPSILHKKLRQDLILLTLPRSISHKNSFNNLFFYNKNTMYTGDLFFKFINKYKFFLWRRYRLQRTKFMKFIPLLSYKKLFKRGKSFKNIHTLVTPLNYLNPKKFIINRIKSQNITVRFKNQTRIFTDLRHLKGNVITLKMYKSAKVFFKLTNYSQLNLKNHTPFFNQKTVTLFLKKFRLTTSRFLKYDINQVVIKYNLKRVRR